MKSTILILLLLLLPVAQGIELTAQSTATDIYMIEKTKWANTQDWGAYDNIEANVYLELDGEPYLVQIINGQVKEIKAGVPNTYDYKITTTTKNANKWMNIAEYYAEHGKLTFRHKYWEIPVLKLQTPVQRNGTHGNVAYMASSVGNAIIHTS